MVARDSLFKLVAVFLVFSLFLGACERPLQSDSTPAVEEVPADEGDEVAEEPEEAPAAEEAGPAEVEEEMPEEGAAEESVAEEEPEAAADAGASEETEEAQAEEETTGEDASPRPTDEEEDAAAAEEEMTEEGAAEDTEAEDAATAEDEAASEEESEETAAESTEHVVKAGENLYRIGLQYGISWVEIAEANGIDNPNRVLVGQVLKIPTDEPAPEVTHTVARGETLAIISARYGVLWTAIAEANNITAPYIIYPGQTLVIPGE